MSKLKDQKLTDHIKAIQNKTAQEKKAVFLRFLKEPGKIFITTVSKKNFQKKVTTTMVDF